MSRTWLITPAFCRAELLHELLTHIYAGGSPSVHKHIIFDNHYPLGENNSLMLKAVAEDFGCTYVDSGRDLGLHHGINNVARLFEFQPDDIVVGCDPDDRPEVGFAEALTDVLRADPKLAVAACNFSVIDHQRARFGSLYEIKQLAGTTVAYHMQSNMWNVAGFNWRFITQIGGFGQTYPYWGGLEHYLLQRWLPLGMRMCYLLDYRSDLRFVDFDDRKLFDPEYRMWKDDCRKEYKGSFSMWLAQRDLLK